MKNATVVLSVLFQLIFNRERMITALLQALYYNRKFLQFDWLRAVVFQLNLKYLHVKITNLLWVVT